MLRFPLPSIRHRLSYDDCVKDNYQNFSVLCCVWQLWTMITYEQFLHLSAGLGLGLVFVCSFRFIILSVLFFCFSLDYFVLVLFALLC